MRLLLFTTCFSFWFLSIRHLDSQDLQTDIYLLASDFPNSDQAQRSPLFLNSFNPSAYNNQVQFFAEDLVYISASKPGQKTDIIALNLKDNEYWHVTKTEEAEFSPTRCWDEDYFSVIRVEKNERSQYLWVYPMDQSNGGYQLFKSLDNIGYHSWLSNNHVAMFLVGEPHRLVIGNVETEVILIISENIGRCLKSIRENELFYVQKRDDGASFLKRYDVTNRNSKLITQMPEGVEDFEFTDDGAIICAAGSILYSASPANNYTWKPFADLSEYNIKDISRIAAKNNNIVLVNRKDND